MRNAQHWATQTHRLNSLDCSNYAPVDHQADTAPHSPAGPHVRHTLPAADPAVPEAALKTAVDELETPDEDLGPIPQPSPTLADHWKGRVTT
ncbi:hypothetical protein [Streptomyces sp. NPDC003710]